MLGALRSPSAPARASSRVRTVIGCSTASWQAQPLLMPGPGWQVVEQKGLDIVRRDWCPLSKDVGNYVLARILSGQPREEVVDAIHLHLQEVVPALHAPKGLGLGLRARQHQCLCCLGSWTLVCPTGYCKAWYHASSTGVLLLSFEVRGRGRLDLTHTCIFHSAAR